MARYEVADSTAHKFWEVTLAGKTLTVRSGRIGTRGRSAVTHFDDAAVARHEYDKFVKQKLRRGYKLVDGVEEPSTAAIATSASTARFPELEAAVIADPNDEAALMVLGDWLQTQGDPRGELISLHYAIKQASTDPKLFLERKRSAEIFYKLHEPGLLGPLHPLRHLFKLEWQLGYIRGAKLSLHAASDGDPDLAQLLRLVVDVPTAVALQELSFGVTRHAGNPSQGAGYQDVIDVLAEGKPGALRSLAFGELWPGVEEQLHESAGSFAVLEGKFEQLRRLVLGAPATMGAWMLPALRHLELRALPTDGMWRWLASSCPRLEYLVLEAFPDDTFERLDAKHLPKLRKLRVHHATNVVDALSGTPLLRQLEGIELGGLEPPDAALLVERWPEFRHLQTARITVNVPIQDDTRQDDRILLQLRTQTTAEVTIHKYYPY
jgi:uncharacterized protein (TIGR02996 family)